MFQCTHCHLPTISIKDKLKAAYWQDITCSNCGTRLADNPIVLGLLHFLVYVQMVAWFIGLWWASHKAVNFLYAAVLWVVLDVFNVWLVPLVALKPKAPPSVNDVDPAP